MMAEERERLASEREALRLAAAEAEVRVRAPRLQLSTAVVCAGMRTGPGRGCTAGAAAAAATTSFGPVSSDSFAFACLPASLCVSFPSAPGGGTVPAIVARLSQQRHTPRGRQQRRRRGGGHALPHHAAQVRNRWCCCVCPYLIVNYLADCFAKTGSGQT
jgi:hypothetical protein